MFPAGAYRGMDISETYIDYARRTHPGHRFLTGDARHSGFDDGEFDQVLMLGFLHHLDDATVPLVLREVGRILKPGGTFLLIEDTPVTSPWNFAGRILMKFDVGSHIRPAASYRPLLERDFAVRRNYEVASGLWRYSVFAMAPRRP
jgi:ubiquinone/menaquinone biosynthesis C-methylase UbiE